MEELEPVTNTLVEWVVVDRVDAAELVVCTVARWTPAAVETMDLALHTLERWTVVGPETIDPGVVATE